MVFIGCVVLYAIVVAWGTYCAPDFYSYILINVWRKTEDKSQRAPSGIQYLRKICMDLCKSVNKKRPIDTDYNTLISVSSVNSVVFLFF